MNRIPPRKANLGLVPQPATLGGALDTLHFLLTCFPFLFLGLPLTMLRDFVLLRPWNRILTVLGRPWYSEALLRITRYYIQRTSGRLLFNRTWVYSGISSSPLFWGYKDWVTKISVNGTEGRWIAPPNTDRSQDQIVLYYLHGGAFVLDTAGAVQLFFLALAKEMNLKRDVQFSIFSLDYELAPEFKYPSQLIESLAGYAYLVNQCGISEDRICLSGDSAGGNLATGLLLHLARPNPSISLPASLGTTPCSPGSALLISPFISLISDLPSRTTHAEFDIVDSKWTYSGAMAYVGSPLTNAGPSWNPYRILFPAQLQIPSSKTLVGPSTGTTDGKGTQLFSSPYVNPIVQKDAAWWREALPGKGKTMVTAGGKEALYDDIVAFIDVLESSGVAPQKLIKTFGYHDWVIFDDAFPGAYVTKSNGPDARKDWAVKSVAKFLMENAAMDKKKSA